MKRFIGVMLLLSVVMSVTAWPKHPEIPSPAGAQYSWDDEAKVWRATGGTPDGGQSVVVEPGTGFINLSTPTVVIGPYAATKLGPFPSGTKNVYITSFGGATIVGPSGIQSGTMWLGAGIIASGTTSKVDGISSTTPYIYAISNESAASTTTKSVGWGQQ